MVLDTRTAEGWVWGRATVDFGDGGFEIIFFGDISPADVPGGSVAEGRYFGRGFGSYEEYRIRFRSHEIVDTGSAMWEGFLVSPHRAGRSH